MISITNLRKPYTYLPCLGSFIIIIIIMNRKYSRINKIESVTVIAEICINIWIHLAIEEEEEEEEEEEDLIYINIYTYNY